MTYENAVNVLQDGCQQLTSNIHLTCPICWKNFYGRNRRQMMERHLATHTGVRPFQCPYCTYCSARRDTLKYHMTKYHNSNN